MSILAEAAPEGSVWVPVLALLAGAVALAIAVFTGLFRLPPAALEPRIPRAKPLWPLIGVLFAGVMMWVGVPSLYVEFVRGRGTGGDAPPLIPAPPTAAPTTTAPTTTAPQTVYGLSAREVIAISAGVPVLAFAVLVLGNVLVRPLVGQRLGVGIGRLGRGARWGVVGSLLAVPIAYGVLILTSLVYQLVGYEPPGDHELLKTIGETPDQFVKYLAMVVAVVIAPLWEELLFRGHVQTLIREGSARMRETAIAAMAAPGGFPVEAPSSGAAVPPETAAATETPTVTQTPEAQPEIARATPREAWVAIVFTSLLFAGVHQPWQFPPIFCLSLCLAIAYERTGNLWVPIVMHALFNGTMTALYLGSSAGAV